jgi:hypothetical protein
VPRVMMDLEPAPHGPGRCGEGLRGAEVAGEPRERAPADLHADPVPGLNPVGGRVQLYVYRQDLVVADLDVGSRHGLRGQPADAVHDVPRDAFFIDVADPDEQVSVPAAGTDEDPRADRPDQVLAGCKRLGGIGQDVGPGFDRGVVDLLAWRLQERSAR